MTRIIRLAENQEPFLEAETFLIPYEKYCCQLMQFVLHKDNNVYIITNKKISGIFYFKDKGIFTSVIPEFSEEIQTALSAFIKDRKIFCITGETSEAEKIRNIILKSKKMQTDDVRKMYFMEYLPDSTDSETEKINDTAINIKDCSISDADKLFPLHISYTKEEILPAWKEIMPALERLRLEEILKTQKVIAAIQGKNFCATARTNAKTKNFCQIGGVFTKKEFRSKGLACSLVKRMAEEFKKENIKTVLFVNEKNKPALCAYKKAGFKIFGQYEMLYYRV